MQLINLGAHSKLDPPSIIRKAVDYFGTGGLGLSTQERTPTSVHFDGGGGYVSVAASLKEPGSEVQILSQEWDYQARQFLEQL